MPRSLLAPLAYAALAASLILGCGGGKGHHGNDPTTPGIVRIAYSTTPLTGATVDFYDQAGTLVGTATVDATGLILGAVPPTAARFGIDPSTAIISTTPPGVSFYDVIQYGDYTYQPSSGCTAPLPSMGSATLKGDVAVFLKNDANTVPPPPPTGCGRTSS